MCVCSVCLGCMWLCVMCLCVCMYVGCDACVYVVVCVLCFCVYVGGGVCDACVCSHHERHVLHPWSVAGGRLTSCTTLTPMAGLPQCRRPGAQGLLRP